MPAGEGLTGGEDWADESRIVMAELIRARQLADGLTLGRAVLGLPLLLALVNGAEALAWLLLLLGGLSDAADGWLAQIGRAHV